MNIGNLNSLERASDKGLQLRLRVILATISLCMGLVGCTYNHVDELRPPVSTCDSLQASYAGDIEPILRTQCYGCHDTLNATAGIVVQLHSNVSIYALNGLFLTSILQPDSLPSSKHMPPGGKLSPCELSIMRSWVAAGAPNN